MRSRRVLATVAVVLVAVCGLAALGVGVALRTVWLPPDTVTATAELDGSTPVALTAPGLPEMRPGPVTVTARAADGGPVLIARGREQDVTAWVGDAPHAVFTGLRTPTALRVEPAEAAGGPELPELPDPAGSDLWVQTESGTGEATLTWDDPQGRWLLLLAADGTRPAPERVTFTWPQEVRTPWATPLLVLGTALLVLAAIATAAIALHRRRRLAAAAADAGQAAR